jgi:hypothetical protein
LNSIYLAGGTCALFESVEVLLSNQTMPDLNASSPQFEIGNSYNWNNPS